MGMASDHLLCQGITDIGHIKLLLFFCNFRIETDMQQHVTQFLADVMEIILDEGIAELVCLLDSIGSQTLVRLFLVPRTIGS